MKSQKYRILGCLLLIGAIAVSSEVILMDANAGFGKTITTAQMANMFGGGWVCAGDTDCDVTWGGCPGGSTDCSGQSVNPCYNCLSGTGKACGAANPWPGWQCVDTTASCNGVLGSCSNGLCEQYTGPDNPPPPSCGTRPNC
jgi:hypothetical protein